MSSGANPAYITIRMTRENFKKLAKNVGEKHVFLMVDIAQYSRVVEYKLENQ